MGERLLCKQEVIGSNPFTSTNPGTNPAFGEDLKTPSGATRAECCLKGEESVCHVTEADRPRAQASACVWSIRRSVFMRGRLARTMVQRGSCPCARRCKEIKRNEKGIWWMPWH